MSGWFKESDPIPPGWIPPETDAGGHIRRKTLEEAIERLENAWENDHPTTLPWGVNDMKWAVNQIKAMLKEDVE